MEKKSGLVSIIIPVYNVQEYLPQCADSVLSQSYNNLDIIFIDDGSDDDSGSICDEYAKMDSRVRVFHTQNGGLSNARNVGLNNMIGDWCAFVDSDDWIEPDMIEVLLNEALTESSEVVQCGVIDEYPESSEKRPLVDRKIVIEGENILLENIISNRIKNYAWNKLYSSNLFKELRFLGGRNYEDIEITHKILANCDKAVLIPNSFYHYRQREGAITKSFNLKNLFDLWKSNRERYEKYCGKSEEVDKALLEPCIHAAGTIWVWTNRSKKTEVDDYLCEYSEVSSFINAHYREIKRYDYTVNYKLKAFFTRFNSKWSFIMMDCIGTINALIKRMRIF